jgi:hypothetical protein
MLLAIRGQRCSVAVVLGAPRPLGSSGYRPFPIHGMIGRRNETEPYPFWVGPRVTFSQRSPNALLPRNRDCRGSKQTPRFLQRGFFVRGRRVSRQ